MKSKMSILALAVFLLIVRLPAATESEYFYYAGDTTIYVDIFNCRAAVKFDTLLNIDPAQFAAEHDFLRKDTEFKTLGDFIVFRIQKNYDYGYAAAQLNMLDEVFMVNPFIKYNCYPIYLTNEFAASYVDSITSEQIDSLNQLFGVIIFDIIGGVNPTYYLYYPGNTDDNLLDLSNRYYETGMCRYTCPNFIYPPEITIVENPHGDVNFDWEVNISDAIYLINFVFLGGSGPISSHLLGDTNCDLDVNFVDIIYLINYLFRGGPAPGTQ